MQAGNNRIRVSAALYTPMYELEGLPWWLSGKEKKKTNLPAKAEDTGSIPRLGRFHGGGNGNLLQYSCLANPTDRRAWRAIQSMRSQRSGHNFVTKQ